MSNTITGFTAFQPLTTISSSEMNTNQQLLKDHSPLWHEFGLSFTDFQTAGNTNTGTLFNADPKEVIQGYCIKHGTSFEGGSITSTTFRLGLSTDTDRYIAGFDIGQTVSAAALFISNDSDIPSFAVTTAVQWVAESGGSTLDSLTAGTLTVWVLKSILI